MTTPATSAQIPHRARTLERVRRGVSYALILYTALIAVLWVLPKGDIPPLWLLCLIPGGLMVWLVWLAVAPRSVRTSTVLPGLPLLIPLALLWFGGMLFMGSGGAQHWLLALPWTFLTMTWPLVMAVGLIVRLAARLMMPSAERKDDDDQQLHREAAAIARKREAELEHDLRMQREVNSQSAPTAPGRSTGLEPEALAGVEIPELEHLHGTPGAGLAGSGFGADRIAKGQAGELNFARALQRRGSLERFATFWSVHMPDENVGASKDLDSDIDSVVVTAARIYLLDVKNYTQGDVTWFLEDGALRLLDNPSGGYIGKPRTMGRTMELAVQRFRTKFADLGVDREVVGRVVFMPTDNGSGTIAPDVRWPGGIPAVTLEQMLGELSTEEGFDPNHPDAEHIERVLRWLVKDESGSAPRLGEAWRNAPGMRRGRPAPAPASPLTQESGTGTAAPPPAAAGAPEPRPSTPEGAATTTTTAPTRTCVECGTVFEPDWTFCWECGRA